MPSTLCTHAEGTRVGRARAAVLIGLARGLDAALLTILLGSIVTVTALDVAVIAVVGAVVVAALLLCDRPLVAITLDEDLARTSGVRVRALNLMLRVLTALTTVVTLRLVGVLLVGAMIVVPT